MRSKQNHIIAVASATAIALTTLSFSTAIAAPVSKHQSVAAASNVDFNSRRRHHRGDRAVLGAVAGIFGTIATLAARDRYYRHYGYGPYYAPYAPPPAPFGYYGPRYYYR
jgi:hypothetical protein